MAVAVLHYVSKLTTILWQPLAWVAVILVAGVALLLVDSPRSRRFGKLFCAGAAVLLLLLGWRPLPDARLRSLEDRYAAPGGDLRDYYGMVVLGGVFRGDHGRSHGQIALGCAGERVVVPVSIVNQYPYMRLLCTGGDASIFPGQREPEADVARAHFERMGTDMSRVITESASRNTFENAILGRAVSGIDANKPWLLVTSASHKPRALATFRKAGWNVTPYPVDYDTKVADYWFSYGLYDGLSARQTALRGYLGLAFYWLINRI